MEYTREQLRRKKTRKSEKLLNNGAKKAAVQVKREKKIIGLELL
jgi:peptidyl-tRNA hydrolase